MLFTYATKGTCSSQITIEIDDNNIVTNVKFLGGCNGNLKAVSKLVTGLPVDEVINKLEGITCGFKPTSCPDQLAQALKQYKENKEN